MNRWGARIVGILMLLALLLVLFNLQKQLTEIARQRGVTTTSP